MRSHSGGCTPHREAAAAAATSGSAAAGGLGFGTAFRALIAHQAVVLWLCGLPVSAEPSSHACVCCHVPQARPSGVSLLSRGTWGWRRPSGQVGCFEGFLKSHLLPSTHLQRVCACSASTQVPAATYLLAGTPKDAWVAGWHTKGCLPVKHISLPCLLRSLLRQAVRTAAHGRCCCWALAPVFMLLFLSGNRRAASPDLPEGDEDAAAPAPAARMPRHNGRSANTGGDLGGYGYAARCAAARHAGSFGSLLFPCSS